MFLEREENSDDENESEPVNLERSMLKHNNECEPYLNVSIQPISVLFDPKRLDLDIYRQMRVEQNCPLLSTDQNMDHKCYPELYPYGKGGLYDK